MRYFMGYKIEIENFHNIYKVKIPTLKINTKSESLGAAIRDALFQQSALFSDFKKPIPLPDYEENFHYKIQLKLAHTNNILLKYGYCSVIGDYVSKAKFSELDRLISESITSSKSYTEVETDIGNILVDYLMLPAQRALIMTSLIMNTDHISNFSHIIENAYFRLMHHDFMSVVLTLTPVIEGILLDFLGFDINKSLPKKSKIYNKILELEYDMASKQMTHPYLFDEYLRSLVLFLDSVFFKNHDGSEEYNYFNRNYISHMMGNENFYTRNNAIKLILLVDLLTFVNSMFKRAESDVLEINRG